MAGGQQQPSAQEQQLWLDLQSAVTACANAQPRSTRSTRSPTTSGFGAGGAGGGGGSTTTSTAMTAAGAESLAAAAAAIVKDAAAGWGAGGSSWAGMDMAGGLDLATTHLEVCMHPARSRVAWGM